MLRDPWPVQRWNLPVKALAFYKYWRVNNPLVISDAKFKSYKLFITEISFILSSLDMIFFRVFPHGGAAAHI